MKKTLLSITLLGLLGATSAFAADTQALTKATVKLIKSDSQTQSSLSRIYVDLEKQSNNDSKLSKEISDNGNLISSNSKKISDNSANISVNLKTLKALSNSFKSVSDNATKALLISQDTRTILNEISLLSSKVEKESLAVTKSTNKIDSKSKSLEENQSLLSAKVNLLEKMLKKSNKDILVNKIAIGNLESDIHSISESLKNIGVKNSGNYRELKESIKSMKIFYEAEISVLKAKLDRAKPVIVTPINTFSKDCVNKKCSKLLTKDEEAILNEYLK